MKISINTGKNKNEPAFSPTLDSLADQWATLIIAHIKAKQNLRKYNDYKFPVDVKQYER